MYLPWANSVSLRLVLGLALLCLAACGPKVPNLVKYASLPDERICRIAVLPFVSETDYPLADTIAYRVFMGELVQTGRFDLAQEGDVREVFRHMRIWPDQQPHIEQIKILGDRLRVGLIITGTVVEMDEVPMANVVNPVIALSLRIVDPLSGETLWHTYHRREGEHYRKVMHFGVLNTVTSLVHQVSQEVLDLWFKKGLKGCTD